MGTRRVPVLQLRKKGAPHEEKDYIELNPAKCSPASAGGSQSISTLTLLWFSALWVLFCILGGSGILLYIILAVLIPSEDSLS